MISAVKRVCTDCLSKTFSPSTTHLPISDANESCLPYSKELEHKLVEYRNTIFNVQHPTASYFLGFHLSVGVTDEVIKYICANYNKVTSPLHLLDIGVVHSHHADSIFEIISKYCDCSSYQ